MGKAAVREIRSKPAVQPIAPLIRELLDRLGEDPRRDGLGRTPERVGEAFRFLTSGYLMDVHRIVNGALYEVQYDAMVVVKDIEFFSLCEHHMLPFFGRMHVAYLPQKKVIGLSKIPRIVDMFARRLQIQERLTQEVAQTIQEIINPLGSGWFVRRGTSA
jgi:GTP cyclohydrolase IA